RCSDCRWVARRALQRPALSSPCSNPALGTMWPRAKSASPALVGADAARADALCRRIANDLTALATADVPRFGPPDHRAEPRGSLSEGWAGIAMFLDLAGAAFDEGRYAAAAAA